MKGLSLQLLGSYRAALDDQALEGLGKNKLGALLAYLAFEHDRTHYRETLAAMLWPEHDEYHARNNLRQALFKLKQMLQETSPSPTYLTIHRDTVQFNNNSGAHIDAVEFMGLIQACQHHAHARIEACAQCMKRLESAIQLYRGDFLEGYTLPDSAGFDMWVEIKQEWLRYQVLGALYYLTLHHEDKGEYTEAQRYARQQIDLDPLREEAHRQLMRIFARTGQRGAALTQYQLCCKELAAELDLEPEDETTRLYRQIRDGVLELPPDKGWNVVAPADTLPASLLPIIGYKNEMELIKASLLDSSSRLVTVLGPGGVGKSTAAMAAASQCEDAFSGGVVCVSLADASSLVSGPANADIASELIQAIAEAMELSVPSHADPRTYVFNTLRSGRVLLLLDSFERYMPATSVLIQMLQLAPHLTILATSRRRLAIHGETIVRLSGFPTNDTTATDSLRLLQDRGRRIDPYFSLDSHVLPHAIRLCQFLGGLPLGIELAAARLDHYTIEQIACATELELGFLTLSGLGVAERHRSLLRVINTSWQALSEGQQSTLMQLGTFSAPFTSEEAYHHIGVVPADLYALTEESLVRRLRTGLYVLDGYVRQFSIDIRREQSQTTQ